MKKKFKERKNLFNITKHGFISGIYFNSIFNNIHSLIDTYNKVRVLDFGCGYGYFKKKLLNNKKITVINFDIVKELTPIDDWRKEKFAYFYRYTSFFIF